LRISELFLNFAAYFYPARKQDGKCSEKITIIALKKI